MGHVTSKNYLDLQKRLNQSPQGAPASDALFKILEILFSEEEAKLASLLPLKFFTVKTAAKLWKKSEQEAEKILNDLADKGILLDMQDKDKRKFILAPTMAGFFEFSLMRTDGKFDRKVLSELFHQYINIEEGFLKQVLNLDPMIARTFIHENTIQEKDLPKVLDYEKATEVINTATCITVGTCYCRHKMEHKGEACDMPQDVCLSFNSPAKSLAKHGISREINKEEAMKILDNCVDLGLVQIGDNVQNKIGWICNCCGCCCEALLAYKKLGCNLKMISNFVSEIDKEKCTACGICVKRCPVDAITIEDNKAKVDPHKCIGCGVCIKKCPSKTMTMERREDTQYVPRDSFERMVVSAISEGKLQNLIFDNQKLWTHAMLRNLLSIILKLPPAKQVLANQQLRSKFLNAAAKVYAAFGKKFVDGKIPDYSHPELKR